MEERYRRRPTIITTNLDYPEWQSFLGNKALVEALLSRLRHQCHTVRIDGPPFATPRADPHQPTLQGTAAASPPALLGASRAGPQPPARINRFLRRAAARAHRNTITPNTKT
jgi:hypothetical protein